MSNAMADLAELRAHFDACDHDGDGRIEDREFSELLQKLDADLSVDECLLAFQATDDDQDGAINFQEFVAWWTQ